jgi:hypothetical protein
MTVIDRLQRAMHMESAAIAPRTSEAIEAMRAGIAEIERLGEVVRQRTFLLDQQMGTPCEQVRHEQEIERLRAALGIIYHVVRTPTEGKMRAYTHFMRDFDEIRKLCREALNPRYVCETCRDNPYLCSTIPTSHCAKAAALKDE